MKQMKFLAMMLALVLSLGFTSCGEKNDPGDPTPDVPGLNDFYITAKVSGGGLSAVELTAEETAWNLVLLNHQWAGYKVDAAIVEFDYLMEGLVYENYYGDPDLEAGKQLKIVFTLKTTKGVDVKKSTMIITNKTAWLE